MNIMNKTTLRSLKKNKTRTLVTIIGIILSAAMLTAVTTFASSIQNFLLEYAISISGDWHGRVDVSNLDYYQDIVNDERIDQVGLVGNDGYSLLEGGMNEYKPYLYIMELSDQAIEMLPFNLTKGRLPENSDELVLSNHIHDNGGVEYKLGETIELELGNRISDGYVLDQSIAFLNGQEDLDESITAQDGPDALHEEFQVNGTRKFTIVGFCERLHYDIEGFSAPGYSVFTRIDDDQSIAKLGNINNNISLYVNLKNPSKIYDLANDLSKQGKIDSFAYNAEVLRYYGVSNIDGFTAVLYGFSAIILTLIILGGVSLIYNSFSISISERSKQFGLLSSVGATRKQLTNSVLFEALAIAIIGIPTGILSGIIGIGITLNQLKGNFARIFGEGVKAELTLHVSMLAIAVAIILSLVTILISAYIPAKRIRKLSTLDAIRQTADIKLSSKDVKTSKITRKIYGIEGDLALKNLKRNKKRYRSTVISLFISVLLFISASAFSMYLTDGVENVIEDYNFDLSYNVFGSEIISEGKIPSEYIQVYKKMQEIDTISDSSLVRRTYGSALLDKELINPNIYSSLVEDERIKDGDDFPTNISLFSVDHETFANYLNELNIAKDTFANTDSVSGILVDKQHYYETGEERYINTQLFKRFSGMSINVSFYTDEGKKVEIPISVDPQADHVPMGVDEYSYNDSIIIIVDEEVINNTSSSLNQVDWNNQFFMHFKSEDPNDSFNEMEKILEDESLYTGHIYNVAKEVEDNRNVITIINVFAYGFIILMSFITIANVFNTITTNINLRRREFAMLKSVGMTSHGFNKMLNFECIFYGLKALFYGIPASIIVTFLIHQVIIQGVTTDFYLPIRSILISIFSVFIVVFISMMYSMRKVRNENIIDALKNENL